MATPAIKPTVGSSLTLSVLAHDVCYRCSAPSKYLIHDSRGCVPACEGCTRWREHQSIVEGHAPTCPEAPEEIQV